VNPSAPATNLPLAPTKAPGNTTEERALVSRAWAKWGLLIGLWSIPGLISTSQLYFLLGQRDTPVSFRAAFLWQFPPWLFWAFMTPIVLRLGRRFPLERGRLGSSIGVHLLATLVAAVGHFIVSAACGRLAGQEFYLTHGFVELVGRLFVRNIHLELFTYWGVLAMVHAFEYHRRFREREVTAAKLETQLAQAELTALKMQLHPHFLFNTLNTVAVLVRKQDTQGSIRMLTGLSDMLRIALENVGRQVVPFKQELDFADRYLQIEKTRFQDRLSVKMSISPEVLEAEVPNLILQPIVENAIRHGIAPRASSGSIEVEARKEGGDLAIYIRDDGKGLGKAWDASKCKGVGLSNVCARLEQLYGKKHRFSIEDQDGGGVLVTMKVPFRLDASEHAHG
jgi:hypothetical protein